jgi:hypothetical protein
LLFSGLLSGLPTQREISEMLDELYYDDLPLGSSPIEHKVSNGPTEKRAVGGHTMEERKLPKFDYYLDESDPDILVLCRQDATVVGMFSASGATKEGIREAAMEDYRAVIQADGVQA